MVEFIVEFIAPGFAPIGNVFLSAPFRHHPSVKCQVSSVKYQDEQTLLLLLPLTTEAILILYLSLSFIYHYHYYYF